MYKEVLLREKCFKFPLVNSENIPGLEIEVMDLVPMLPLFSYEIESKSLSLMILQHSYQSGKQFLCHRVILILVLQVFTKKKLRILRKYDKISS